MEIIGYKAFYKDKTNRYGMLFEEGEKYSCSGELKFGNDGNGFHFCTHLSDVFRYYSSEDCVVARVVGSGSYLAYNDEYYGYYDMYVTSELEIKNYMTREEVISEMLGASEYDVLKFIKTFKLLPHENIMFINAFYDKTVLYENLLYYQLNVKNIFGKNDGPILRKVINNGQNNS